MGPVHLAPSARVRDKELNLASLSDELGPFLRRQGLITYVHKSGFGGTTSELKLAEDLAGEGPPTVKVPEEVQGHASNQHSSELHGSCWQNDVATPKRLGASEGEKGRSHSANYECNHKRGKGYQISMMTFACCHGETEAQ